MKIRLSKCYFILGILLFFILWQILLILITLKDDFVGIDYNSFDNDLNQTKSSIPLIIHQTWKTLNLSTYPINNSHLEWKRLYPSYKIRLWTDKELNDLIFSEPYKYLYNIYKSYPYSIQRADLSRLVILHHEGGIYADLDVFPCSANIEDLRLTNASFIIPRSFSGSSLINHFLVAQKSSPIIDFILHEMSAVKFYKRIYIIPYLEVFSTGSIFLSRVIRKYIKLNNNKKDILLILSENQVTKYVTHYTGRSWHLFDGFILNLIDSHQKTFLIILTFFIFVLFYICKRHNFQSKIIPIK